MLKKIILSIALIFLLPWHVYGGSIPMPTGMSCEGSQMPDGTYIPKGQVKEVTYGGVRYRCVGCGGCTPISSGSSTYTPSYVPSSRLTPSQQMTIGIMGSFLSGFFGTLFSGMFDMNDNSAQKQAQYEAEQKRIADERKKEEERKKQLLAQYNQLITQAKQQVQSQPSNPAQSPFSFQTLGGQLTAFQWQKPSMSQPNSSNTMEQMRVSAELNASDLNKIFGNVIQDKVTESIEEKIDNIGEKLFEKLDEKYKKTWGSKINEHALPIMKIAVTAKTEGVASAGAQAIDEYLVSFITKPMSKPQATVSEIGRKIYTQIAFTALDKFLTKTEEASQALGFNFSKDEFMNNFESDMNFGQKMIYKWLKGE
ncbi:hypothetical protein QI155_00595 [Thermodesulfovibrio sp. 1176]|uniref:hypothetical protein n=1 Tax=Thermodesulfovibrio sp. 1176 TaxID=3043424 RepID=UPI0024824A50|nr:hypothetical protein [Thermodesulfovibrio sp. 1176]MDI1471036.1 hypothetical protein [Thermodesulfovibrio sp. 1176]